MVTSQKRGNTCEELEGAEAVFLCNLLVAQHVHCHLKPARVEKLEEEAMARRSAEEDSQRLERGADRGITALHARLQEGADARQQQRGPVAKLPLQLRPCVHPMPYTKRVRGSGWGAPEGQQHAGAWWWGGRIHDRSYCGSF